MSYAIFYFKNTENGIKKQFLYSIGGDFGDATNLTFKSVNHAINWLKQNKVSTPIATQVMIQGPKGGVYSGYSGRLLK